MQPLRTTFLHAAAGNDPLPAGGPQPIACWRVVQQCAKAGTQVGGLAQACGLVVDDQFVAVGVCDGIALAIEQHDFGIGGYNVLGQRRGQFRQGQVGAHDGVLAAAPGEGGADIAGGEKEVGLGGDLIAVAASAGVPGAGARIVGVVGVVVTAEEVQVLIEKQ
ncbi:hypothetical protein D3C84_840830 [compost metagenome]